MNDPKAPPGSSPTLAKRTLVEDGTTFKGSLTSTCPVVVQGSIEGDVEGPSLTVSATGAVSGTIVTSDLKSEGRISGDFDVDTAQLAGSVASDTVIRAASLDVKLAVESGKLQLTFGPGAAGGGAKRS
jgi:cytoskeletal protein CcmA (bactofilin family)